MAPNTKDEVDLEELAQRVQDLPAELYDMVLEYTFTADEERVAISPYYKPLARLHVSRATRDLFAKNYYVRTRFFVRPWLRAVLIDRFVHSLSAPNVILLAESMDPPLSAAGDETDRERLAREFVVFDFYFNF